MALTKWTKLAETDLEDIVVYIAEESHRLDAARKVYAGIREKCDVYATQPFARRATAGL